MSERDTKEIPCQRAMVKDGFFMVSVVAGKRFLMVSVVVVFMVSVVAGNFC